MRSMLSVVGSLAMMVGGVIVFQPVSVSVRQRRRAFGLFTPVGITRSTERVLCLVEVAVLAGAVALPASLAGRWLAALDGGVVVGAIGEIWLRLGAKVQLHSFSSGLLAVLLGVGVALAAATLALHGTSSMPVVETLGPVEVRGFRAMPAALGARGASRNV